MGHLAAPTSRRTLLRTGAALALAFGGTVTQSARPVGGAAPRDNPPNLRGSRGFVLLSPVRPAPAVALHRLDGAVANLAKFRGKVVLLNFWASWCAPCVAELPSLERLSAAMADEPVEIAAISVDREGAAVVAPFVRRLGLLRLALYLDAEERIGYFTTENPNGAPFALYRMPISYLVDANGMIRGYVPGAARWDTGDAGALLRHYMR